MLVVGCAEKRPLHCRWAVLNKGEHARVARKMVMNIGQNPTVNTQDAPLTVEVHVMHDFGADFYGEAMRVVVTGFIRWAALSASESEVHATCSSHAAAHTTAGTCNCCRDFNCTARQVCLWYCSCLAEQDLCYTHAAGQR